MDFIDQLKPFIEWIHQHPDWAGFVIFLISMSESLAVIGLIIPGTIIMSAVGTLVGAHVIPVVPTFIWAITGAIVGDILSYYAGFAFNDRIPGMWPFRRYPHWLRKAQEFFNHHGGKSVFLGRFLGPMRPITPIVAGMMRMPPIRFVAASTIASTLWAPVYMLPGILIGAASQELEPATATRFLITIVTVLVVIGLSAWLFNALIRLCLRGISRQANRLWLYLKHARYTARFCQWLADPAAPDKHSQLVILISLILLGALGIWCAWDVYHQGMITLLNKPTQQLLLNLNTTLATQLFAGITLLGSNNVLIPTIVIGFLWLLLTRQWQTAWHWLLGPLLVMAIMALNNTFVYYPRPSSLAELYTTNSFPSTRTALSIVVYGFFAVILTRPMVRPLQRLCIYYSATVVSCLIIFSRLYLGMHWLTDILGGIVCGVWVLLLVSMSFRRHRIYDARTNRSFSMAFFASLGLAWSLQVLQNYRDFTEDFAPFWPTYQVSVQNWWKQSEKSQPLYRSNRVGRPVQIMNVQWLGDLDHITQYLEAQGWTIKPKSELINVINSLSSHDKEKRIPILQPLYLGQKPILVAMKRNKELKQVLLLQLWHSKFTLTDSKLPLWVGTIEYRQPHPRKFWETRNYKRKYIDYPSPIEELRDLPKSYQVKLLHYPAARRPLSVSEYEWNGGVVFIRE